MDNETGENHLIDQETGEPITTIIIDEETGEMQTSYNKPNQISFKVAKEYILKKDEIHADDLRTVTIAPALLYMLPTAFFFNTFIAVFLSVLEITLHIWAHRKNKMLRGTGVYYQSPMHIFVSEFCACCRDEESSKKINKIQERRNRLKHCSIECVRQIVT